MKNAVCKMLLMIVMLLCCLLLTACYEEIDPWPASDVFRIPRTSLVARWSPASTAKHTKGVSAFADTPLFVFSERTKHHSESINGKLVHRPKAPNPHTEATC